MGLSATLYRTHKDIDTPHFGYASLYWLRHELAPKFGFVYTQDIGNDDPDIAHWVKVRIYDQLTEDDVDVLSDGQKVITNYHKFRPTKDEMLRWTDKTYNKKIWEFFMAPDSEGVIDLEHCKYYYDKFKDIKLKINQERLNILLTVLKAGVENNSGIVYC